MSKAEDGLLPLGWHVFGGRGPLSAGRVSNPPAALTRTQSRVLGRDHLSVTDKKRVIEFERLHNFRDVGGYLTQDGRTVAWRRLYRSDSLAKLGGADWERFLTLGVRTVIDLRYAWEIEKKGRVPDHDGIAYHNFSVEHRPYDQTAMDPDVDPARLFADKHAEVANDGVRELRASIEVIASHGTVPVVVHCTTGKDRTGLVIALVLGLLGVSEDDIVADYALTELATERFVADWRADDRNPPLRWPGYGRAPAKAMQLFLSELASRHGSLQVYAREQLGVDDTLIAALKAQLLES